MPAHSYAALIGGEPAAEYIDAAYPQADHRVLFVPKVLGLNEPLSVFAVSDVSVNRIAVLQPIQASARLHCRVEVGGGESEPVVGNALPPGALPLPKLKSLPVLAFCAAIKRLPSHCEV